MADNGIVIEGLDEFRKKLEELKLDNTGFEKRLRDAIRKVLAEARSNLSKEAASGLQMQSDPRKAYKAVRMAVYRRIFGGQVNILQSNKAGAGHYYEPPRHPSHRGGNRIAQSGRTRKMMSYQGSERGFILRFLNQGTDVRYTGGRNGRTESERFRFIESHGGRGHRGSIAARNWFGSASQRELENAAEKIQDIIDKVIKEEFV